MMRYLGFLLAFLMTAAGAAEGPKTQPPTAAPDPSQGMVVTGDQEAPLVLYILPWQPPQLGGLPEVEQPPSMPKLLDSERSVLDDPLNRSEPAAFRLIK